MPATPSWPRHGRSSASLTNRSRRRWRAGVRPSRPRAGSAQPTALLPRDPTTARMARTRRPGSGQSGPWLSRCRYGREGAWMLRWPAPRVGSKLVRPPCVPSSRMSCCAPRQPMSTCCGPSGWSTSIASTTVTSLPSWPRPSAGKRPVSCGLRTSRQPRPSWLRARRGSPRPSAISMPCARSFAASSAPNPTGCRHRDCHRTCRDRETRRWRPLPTALP